jgi:hypothetical protein
MLAEREVDALDERGVAMPTPWGQDVHDASQSAEHHPWPHVDQAAAAGGVDDLGIQQLWAWQPAGLGSGAGGARARWSPPLPAMRE